MARWSGTGPIQKLGTVEPDPRRWATPAYAGAPAAVPSATADLLPEPIRELVRRVGDRWAKAVQKLQERGIVGSTPELLVYAWLQAKHIPFEFQSSMFGGRAFLGGQIPDFVLKHLPEWIVVRVQGEYWHRAQAKQQDRAEKVTLLASNYRGRRIAQVVDVWENDIYERLETVMTAAVAGRGIRER